MRARLVRIGSIIEAVGFEGLPTDTVKHLEGKLWELRIRGKDGIARAVYVTAVGRRVVIVRVLVKKTQKTPQHATPSALHPHQPLEVLPLGNRTVVGWSGAASSR